MSGDLQRHVRVLEGDVDPFRASVNDPPVWAMMNQMFGEPRREVVHSRTTSSEGWIRQYACIRFPYSYQGNQTGSLYGMKVLG